MQKSKLKQFDLGDEKSPPIWYRPGTSDEGVIQTIVIDRADYKFPKKDFKLIYDIGANIGVATLVMNNIYPEAIIHCFEPDPENFEVLRMNTEHLGPKVVLNKVALSNYNGTTQLYGSDNPVNLGGFSTHIKPPEEQVLGGHPWQQVPVVRTSFYMAKVGVPDLIKIDCEGAEHDILMDIPDLSKVQWITGELHGIKEFELLASIQSKGFEVDAFRHMGSKTWPFQAANKKMFFVKDAPQPSPRLAAPQ